MCGIAGSFGADIPDPDRIRGTLALMRHRGPDAEGVWSGVVGRNNVTLLHSRLSIIDLDPRANQPFVDGDNVLVYNGELYNYLELRTELEARGHVFRTRSDTEVLHHAWREWGLACTERFEGMWAFALIDLGAGRLVLSRDRFGEKPLHYLRREGTVYFGSEVKLLAALSGAAPAVDAKQLRRYLVNGYRSLYKQPATFFEDVHELPAGASACLREPGPVDARRYWRLSCAPRPMTRDEAVAGVRERVEEALRLRLRADVPLAFCLSGGVDSSALAAVAVGKFDADVHAFSIVDGDERYDESENIQATVDALQCRHHVIRTSTEGFLDRMSDLVAYHDAPVATISYYVHAFLSEAIGAAGYKVAVSGTGADELFTGYYDHYGLWLAEMNGRIGPGAGFERLIEEWRGGYGSFVRNPVLRDPLAFLRDPGERSHIYLDRETFNSLLVDPLDEDFFEERFVDDPLRNRMLNELFHEVVPVILHEDDRNSMRWSVENRSPYLDRNLAEFLYTVPGEHLIRDGYAKSLLRDAVAGVLPDKVRLDKRKRGFNASIDSLLDRRDPEVVDRLLADGPVFDVVKRDAFARFLDGDMTENSFSKFLFGFVSAKLFLESDLASGTMRPRAAMAA